MQLLYFTRYRQYFNKKSEHWNVYVLKESKGYHYIPDLQKAILAERLGSGMGLPRIQGLRPDDPRRLGLLAATQPPTTYELIAAQVSQEEGGAQSEC